MARQLLEASGRGLGSWLGGGHCCNSTSAQLRMICSIWMVQASNICADIHSARKRMSCEKRINKVLKKFGRFAGHYNDYYCLLENLCAVRLAIESQGGKGKWRGVRDSDGDRFNAFWSFSLWLIVNLFFGGGQQQKSWSIRAIASTFCFCRLWIGRFGCIVCDLIFGASWLDFEFGGLQMNDPKAFVCNERR